MPNRVNSTLAELGNIRNKTPENLIIKKVCDLLSRIDTRSLRSFHLDKRKESRSFFFSLVSMHPAFMVLHFGTSMMDGVTGCTQPGTML